MQLENFPFILKELQKIETLVLFFDGFILIEIKIKDVSLLVLGNIVGSIFKHIAF